MQSSGQAERVAPLQAALGRLHLDGAIFLRAEYTEAWAYGSRGPDVTQLLHPGADRVILFHVVAAGECWISVEGGQRLWARAGDVIVLPYGDTHFMGGPAECEMVPIRSLLAPPPWHELPVIRHGSGGERTDVVCGYLHCDDPMFDPQLRAFPAVLVVRPEGAAATWVRASIDYALQQSGAIPATGQLPTRVPEFLLVEVLRLHLASAPAAEHGWPAALTDPVVGPAMALMHGAPAHKWTVAELAARNAIAPRVGYDAEEAFSRAFKRERGVSPGFWRSRYHAQRGVVG